MKKYLLLATILFQVGILAAQERDNVGHRVGSWNMSANPCYKGLVWKIRKSFYSDNSDNYTNEIEIKNNYGATITFSYNMSENANETTTRYRKTLASGQTYTSTYCPNINLVSFYVTEVCFNNNCKSGCYAQCDNGSPNQPDCTTSNSTNSPSSNNQTSTYANNSQNKITSTYTPPQPTKSQKQAEALNQVSSSLMELAKVLDNAKAEKKERQRKEAAEQNEKQIEQQRKIEQERIENSSQGIIIFINQKQIEKIRNYFIKYGEVFSYHEGIDNQNIDVFEHFNLSYQSDRANIVFPIGKEKYMISLLNKLTEIQDYITFYAENNTILNNAFSITNKTGNITYGHGELKNYNSILNAAAWYNKQAPTGNNLPTTMNVSTDYASVLKNAQIEAGKETDEGYKAATKLLEPYANSMNGDDLNSLGLYFWKVKDYLPAVKFYKMSGDKGNDWGNNNLAICYENGWGGDTNYIKAFEYYKKVSTSFKNIGETYHRLGHLCAYGANNAEGKSDYTTASSYYTMGANVNNSDCMLHLGEFYDTDGKLITNLALAKYWYKKACDLKEEKACTKLKALE